MSVTLYDVLELPRSATEFEVQKSFRKLALQWHPSGKHNEEQQDAARARYLKIAEAFTVLSDRHLRHLYDQFGAEGLQRGSSLDRADGFKFDPAEADRIFEKFFGVNIADSLEPMRKGAHKTKAALIQLDLVCSLEELCCGAKKEVSVTVQVLNNDRATTHTEERSFVVDVHAGWRAGTAVTFEGQGNQGPHMIAGDVALVVREAAHAVYSRNGDDLSARVRVPLVDALVGGVARLPSLDGRTLAVPLNTVISPGSTVVLPKEGMPNARTGARGDLTVLIDVEFPKTLSVAQKALVRKALTGSEL